MSKEHFVKEGDSISSIAFENGFFPDTIWNHPQNASLKEKRKVGTVLKAGDTVFIPDFTRKSVDKPCEAEHVFRRKGVPEKLRIRFLDQNNEPRSGRRYIINIDGRLRDGKTDGDGFVSVYIPPNCVKAKLIIFEDNFEEEYNLMLGYLPPITELAGVTARLSQLGYPAFGKEAADEQIRNSIFEFQKNNNIEPSGELNNETRVKIQEIYGA